MKRFKNIHVTLVMLCLPFLMHAQVVRVSGNANIIVTGDAKIVLHDGNLAQGSFGTNATPITVTGYYDENLLKSGKPPVTNNVLIDKSYGNTLVSTDNTYIYLGTWEQRMPTGFYMQAWPNPTTSRLTISIHRDNVAMETIALQDDHGRVLERKRVLLSPGINTVQWNLSRYAVGSYTLVFENSPGKFLKIVKQ